MESRPAKLRNVSHLVASRKAISSPRRRYLRLSLFGSALAAVFAGLSDPWLMPFGLVLSVAGGVFAAYLGLREARVVEVELRAEQAAEAQRAAELFHEASQRQVGVVKVMSARNDDLTQQLDQTYQALSDSRISLAETQTTLAALSREASSLRGDKASLQFELNQRTQELAAATQSLAEAQADGPSDVVDLPQRFEVGTDIWTEDGYPTVVQLAALANPVVSDEDLRKRA